MDHIRVKTYGPILERQCKFCGQDGCLGSMSCLPILRNVGAILSNWDTSQSSSKSMAPRLQVNPDSVSTYVGCLENAEFAPAQCFLSKAAWNGILSRLRERGRSLLVLLREPTDLTRQTITFSKVAIQDGTEEEFFHLASVRHSRVYPKTILLDYLTSGDTKLLEMEQ